MKKVLIVIIFSFFILYGISSQEVITKSKIASFPSTEASGILIVDTPPLIKDNYIVLPGTKISYGGFVRTDVIRVINKWNGSIVWERFVGELINDYYLLGNTVVVITEKNRLFAFNMNNGQYCWSYPEKIIPVSNTKRYYVDPRKLKDLKISLCGFVDNDYLFVFDLKNQLIVKLNENGEEVKKTPISNIIKKYRIEEVMEPMFLKCLIVSRNTGLIYVGKKGTIFNGPQSYIILFDITTGQELSSYLIPEIVASLYCSYDQNSLILKSRNRILILDFDLKKRNEILLECKYYEYGYGCINNDKFLSYGLAGIGCYDEKGKILWEFPKDSKNILANIKSIIDFGSFQAVEKPLIYDESVLVKSENKIFFLNKDNGNVLKEFVFEQDFPLKKDLYYILFSARCPLIELDKEKKLYGVFLTKIEENKDNSGLFEETKYNYSDWYYVIKL
ncbi:MAG: PQQ-like beta-propeller repeat protein [Treponemataceae bacterium]|nr:PQQ-like beta-propeller repeat protein [Treponemataceae bacterium]